MMHTMCGMENVRYYNAPVSCDKVMVRLLAHRPKHYALKLCQLVWKFVYISAYLLV